MLPVLRKKMYYPVLFNDLLGSGLLSNLFSDGADYNVPAVNIKENENGFEIEVAAPGLKKEDFHINIEKNILTVSSKRENQNEEKNGNFMRQEFSFNSFCRSFSIPNSVDQNKVTASQNDGILKIELPKLDEVKTKKIRTIEIE
jgi:HSP20 family protein